MLFAQAEAYSRESIGSPISGIYVAIIVVGLLLGVVLVFTLLVMWHLRNSRKLLHAERMRSIEMGHPLEEAEPTELQAKFIHNAFWIAFWLALGVPVAAFWSAALATEKAGGQFALGLVIWIAAAAASIAAVICATVLMVNTRTRADAAVPAQKFLAKPSVSS